MALLLRNLILTLVPEMAATGQKRTLAIGHINWIARGSSPARLPDHSKCKKEGKLGILPSIAGKAGSIKVKLHDVSAMICPENHRWFAYPASGALPMDYFMDYGNLRTLTPGKKIVHSKSIFTAAAAIRNYKLKTAAGRVSSFR